MGYYIYYGTIFMSFCVYMLLGILLLLRRNEGGRARVILSVLMFLLAGSYLFRIFNFATTPILGVFEVMPVQVLMLAFPILVVNLFYPIEVISPRWLNLKRALNICIPVLVLFLVYWCLPFAGVVPKSYYLLTDLLADFLSISVLSRFLLFGAILVLLLLVYLVPYAKDYNHTNKLWMRNYVLVIMINTLTFLLVLCDGQLFFRIVYTLVCLFCILYLFYQELFIRIILPAEAGFLIAETNTGIEMTENLLNVKQTMAEINLSASESIFGFSSHVLLFKRLETYMEVHKAWRNPDLTLPELALCLGTNRTSLLQALKQHGFEGYVQYLNRHRVSDFIQIIEMCGENNYIHAFFKAGYRSKSSAFRNFKNVIGMTPKEYFGRFPD